MEFREYSNVSRTLTCLWLLFLGSKFSQAQDPVCSLPALTVHINENITGVVSSITRQPGVTLSLTVNPLEAFELNGDDVILKRVLDFENPDERGFFVNILCEAEPPADDELLRLGVFIRNINDNPPAFNKTEFRLDVNELTPLNTVIGRIEATDADRDQLYYRLDNVTEGFVLAAEFNPDITVNKILDYDSVQMVRLILYAQDTPTPTPPDQPSFTASATLLLNIIDIDNRPPWFQPCHETVVGITKICQSSGYNGTVNLNEIMDGPLSLEPGPVHAIDGDKNRNELINYKIIGGDDADTFKINENSGEITMLKAVDVAGPIILTVLAHQVPDTDKFATTTVTLKVVLKTLHPPEFVKASYEGYIAADAGLESMVLGSKTSSRPLRVEATDQDFGDGKNPNLEFEVLDNSGFTITPQGFVLMVKELSPGTVTLQMRVVDTMNGESGEASLTVEVTPGIGTTTALPPTTMPPTTMPPTTMPPTTMPPTTIPSTVLPTTDMITDTTPQTDSASTPFPTDTDLPAATTARPEILQGEYGVVDMAALGGTLAVVLVISLVVIALLAVHVRKSNANWEKLSEASHFHSSLGGAGGPKEGIQYTNEGFQKDNDVGSMTSQHSKEVEFKTAPTHESEEETLPKPKVQPLITTELDGESLAGSDNTDGEKEVRPILTKERRVEEGYKSVWFKEDIDPDAMEEVVIIPDSGERDMDEEEEEEEEEDEGHLPSTGLDEELAGKHINLARHGESDSDDDDARSSSVL